MDVHPSHLAHRIGPVRAGLAMALVGALLAGFGLFATTSADVLPSCPTGTVLTAHYQWDGGASAYTFVEPSGNGSAVTITSPTAQGGTWSADRWIAAVVVKGGPGSKQVAYSPPTNGGTFVADGLPQVGGSTPDIEHVLFCAPTPSNPANAATGFNVVTSGDARLAANESEGPVAVGGDLSFDQYQIAIHSAGSFKVAPTDSSPTALLVRGKLLVGASAGKATVEQGWVAIGDGTGVEAKRQNPNQLTVNATGAGPTSDPMVFGQNSSQALPTAIRTSSFDFDGVFAAWQNLASGLGACPATVTLAGANGPTWPWTSGDAYVYPQGSGQQVLNLDADTLSRLTSLTFRDGAVPNAARPLIINVSGVPTNWNPPNLNGDTNTIARYVIWNFGALTSVTVTGGNQLAGTILLPSGTFDQQGNGNLVGAVYSGSFTHGGGAEVHDHPFNTTVTPCGVTPPPTSSTTSTSTTSTTTSTTASTTTSTSTTTSSIPDTSTSSVPDTTTSSVPDTSTTSTSTSTSTTTSSVPETTTTTEAPTTTESPTTTDAPTTTSTEAPTSSTTPDSTTSSVPDSTTTTVPSEVQDVVTERTEVVQNDNAAAGVSRAPLAFTGSASIPMVVFGIILLGGGLTLVLVAQMRRRRSTV